MLDINKNYINFADVRIPFLMEMMLTKNLMELFSYDVHK